MKKHTAFAVAAAAALLATGLPVVFAQDADAPKPVEITVDGVNYCVLCELSQDDVAGANSTYATMNALRVTAAVDPDGNVVEGLEGKTLHYLPTKDAQPLLVGEQHRGVHLTIVADYYAEAGVIKVKEIVDEESGWTDLPVPDGSLKGPEL